MIIKNGLVFNEEGRFEEKDVFIDGDRISTEATGEVIDAKGLYVIPGLTDIHFHACVGYDFVMERRKLFQKWHAMNWKTELLQFVLRL